VMGDGLSALVDLVTLSIVELINGGEPRLLDSGSVVDWRLELVQVPVSDVDRAKAFYTEKVGFNADHDYQVTDELRFVQLTPPGSACSIAIGTGLSKMPPGSVEGLQMVVSDIHAARKELAERGVEVSDVQDFPWGSFVFFSDPDGNSWAVQAIPPRE
jgi:predicted enzyme related to lactoylglutathione lyase